MSDWRLSPMENKLDKRSEVVIATARMEERMITVFKRLDMIDVEQENPSQTYSQTPLRVRSD